VTELARECETLRDNLLALTGRNGWLESKLEERESQMRLLTERKPRPVFWKRILRLSESGGQK
jgi:hypothetical protein